MKTDKNNKWLDDALGKAIGSERKEANFESFKQKHTQAIEQLISRAGRDTAVSSPNIWRNIMKSRITKLAAAAVIIIAVLIGISHFGGSIDGTSVAWAQQTLQALEKVKAIAYRQTAVRVRDYSQDDMSGGWETRYYAKDAYRRDLYDKSGEILNTQWILPDGENNIQREVSFEYRCYWDEKKTYTSYYDGLMTHLRRYVSFLDRANRILGTEFYDGKECIGFEISPGKYDDFTVTRLTRIWFDTETKLPAQIERHGIQTDYDPSMKLTIIHDQFDYYVEVPADMFTPRIPQGFVNAHRDEIIAQSKGELLYADVPQELRDEIISAIKNTQTVFYQEHLEVTVEDKTNVYPAKDFFIEKNSWREDRYTWRDKLQKTHWYNTKKQTLSDTDFEFEEDNFRLTQTTVDYENNTYSVKTHKEHSFRSHPMEDILFLASLVNKADRVLENTEIDGIECFGFEISAIKYGDNSPTDKHRLWFDKQTKLPVRMGFEYWQSDGRTKSLRVRDQFQWDTELSKETFKPIIPEGFELIGENNK